MSTSPGRPQSSGSAARPRSALGRPGGGGSGPSRPPSRGTTYVRESPSATKTGEEKTPHSARKTGGTLGLSAETLNEILRSASGKTGQSELQNILRPKLPEPSCFSQTLAQHAYERFRARDGGPMRASLDAAYSSQTQAATKPMTSGVPQAWTALPCRWRPSPSEVAEEVQETGSSVAQAVAALLVGRDVASALARNTDYTGLIEKGTLDLKAWVRVANNLPQSARMPSVQGIAAAQTSGRGGAWVRVANKLPQSAPRPSVQGGKGPGPELSTSAAALPLAERVLAAVALLHDVSQISTIDVSGMGLEAAPGSLQAYPGLTSVDLSRNRTLRNLGPLRGCLSLIAVNLAECQKLTDVRPLSVMPALEAVDLSNCDALEDVSPMLLATSAKARGFRPLSARVASSKATTTANNDKQTATNNKTNNNNNKVPGQASAPQPCQAVEPSQLPLSAPQPTAGGLLSAPQQPKAGVRLSFAEQSAQKSVQRPISATPERSRALTELAGAQQVQHVDGLGHPSLKWLCLSGCQCLEFGVELTKCCKALAFVDLFECLKVQPEAVDAVSSALQIRHLVWPSVDMLGDFAKVKEWPHSRLRRALQDATAAVAWKCEVATAGRGEARLPTLLGTRLAAAKQAAERAARDMGLSTDSRPLISDTPRGMLALFAEADSWQLVEGQVETRGGNSKGARDIAQDLPTLKWTWCISPLSFSRGVHASKFKMEAELQYSELFHAIDLDRDGGISLQDLREIANATVLKADVDSAVAVLLCRHRCWCDAAAADLAGNRLQIDRSRITECLVVAGVDETMAPVVAEAIAYCSAERLKGIDLKERGFQAAIAHGLSGYAVAYAAALLESFLESLKQMFQASEEAFSWFDAESSGSIASEELCTKLQNVAWQGASEPGDREVVSRILDLSGTGKITSQEFTTFWAFEAARTLEAMESTGRAISRFPTELPGPFSKFDLNPAAKAERNRGISRRDFVSSWKDLGHRTEGVSGRIVFGLLDWEGNNRIFREQMLVLVDALPRRGEVAAVAALNAHLTQQFGSLEEAHASLCTAGAADTTGHSQKDKKKPRH
ncbi:unnamed protein product [Polarella glacialis]|uniref:EF-hand domain-containing protein n=1 Tax=Polarella glacialis TaxID=89957 RepID=A0A813DMM1_POLGL|nr:unnamed protein product [Polarella glacialis]